MTRVAILADPHFHDIDFDPAGAGMPRPALRTLADSTESTRVFNESGAALRAALDEIVARSITLVLIVGDLTDDGQVFNWRAVSALLDLYRARGLRFFATPGNHDLFAMAGRHQTKRFLRPDGSSVLVSSNPDIGADIVAADMYCPGYPGAMTLMRHLGYTQEPGDLHWETPFGTDPAWSSRVYQALSADGGTSKTVMDASYLVEPEEGLWLLSLDANVYRPNDAGDVAAGVPPFRDCTDVGWNSVLTDKPYLLAWAADVTSRARAQGKTLLAFSHYPVVDPLNGSGDNENWLLGETGFVLRMPAPAVATALASAGIGVHFSGHWHINNTASHRDAGGHVVNIAVPSLVAFPAAFKIAEVEAERLAIETVMLGNVPGFDAAFADYRAEARRDGLDAVAVLDAPDYGAFLDAHLRALVRDRYLPREWPADLARLVPLLGMTQLGELAQSEPVDCAAVTPKALQGEQATLLDLVVDWYAIRKGAHLALNTITPARLAMYSALIAAYAAHDWPAKSLQARIAALLTILQLYLARQPSGDFSVDLQTGAISAASLPVEERSARSVG